MPGREEKCDFVLRTADCKDDDGFFWYSEFVYCLLGDALPAALSVLVSGRCLHKFMLTATAGCAIL